MATSDAELKLVRQVRAGDASAWRQLIRRYEGRLLAFVDSRLRDRAASEDVVQESFIGFLTSLPHYDEKRDMEAYLFSIAAHKLTDHLRKQRRRPIDQFGSDDHGRPLDEVPGDDRPASSIARSDERRDAEERMLTEALGQLVREWLARGDYDRLRCLELLIVKGWANKDVAKYLELTEQAVASYKFQAVGRLKEMASRADLSLDVSGMDDEATAASKHLIEAISHPDRLRLIKLLEGRKEVWVHHLQEVLELSRGGFSGHLKCLSKMKLVTRRMERRRAYYRLLESTFEFSPRLLDFVPSSILPIEKLEADRQKLDRLISNS